MEFVVGAARFVERLAEQSVDEACCVTIVVNEISLIGGTGIHEFDGFEVLAWVWNSLVKVPTEGIPDLEAVFNSKHLINHLVFAQEAD